MIELVLILLIILLVLGSVTYSPLLLLIVPILLIAYFVPRLRR